MQIFGTAQFVGISFAETQGRTELPDPVSDQLGVECRRRHIEEGPSRVVIHIRTQRAHGLGAGVERIEILSRDWPTAVRYPRSALEGQVVERAAPAVPVIGGAAKVAQTGDVEIGVGVADDMPLVELLDIGLEFETAAFEQCRVHARASELARDRDAGGASADNAQIGVDLGVVAGTGESNNQV